VVHLPPLPGKPTPAAAPSGPAGTSRQQQLQHNQHAHQQQHARGAALHRAPGAMPPPGDGGVGGASGDPRAAPQHAPGGAPGGAGGAIAIPTRHGGGDVFSGAVRRVGVGVPGGGAGGAAGATVASVAGVGGAFSFKSSYGSLMDATGMNVYLEGAAGALGGESPLMTAFTLPSSSLGQAASFPRSLGPVGDVLGDMDVGSPAGWDGGAG
jgi:hypothetical protein